MQQPIEVDACLMTAGSCHTRTVPCSYDWEVHMIIDCGTCVARATDACDDCIVTAICGPEGVVEIDVSQRAAIDTMSHLGLVKPIRLIVEESAERRSTAS